ncbi:MAG: J domain-containing protein [Acidobacteriia bacterium]|nr:J domain-containing protein [Terriglobia bacterium]
MPAGPFVDYYETLQISPNADQDTVHRVYRLLAQRFHPDNRDTGNTEIFRQLTEAYQALSDPERRAGYDVHHREARRLTWKIFDQSNADACFESERCKRQGVITLLYRKRLMSPDQPTLTLREFEELLAVPKEHLEFSLWYLKEAQCVQRTDNGRYSITLKGVDLAEELSERRPEPLQLITAATRVA